MITLRTLYKILIVCASLGTVYFVLIAQEPSIYPEKKEHPAESESIYREGDWGSYILNKEYYLDDRYSNDDGDSFEVDGDIRLGVVYGHSYFPNNKYRLNADDIAQSSKISEGFNPQNSFQVLMQGHSGKRLTVLVDHDSTREDSLENRYIIQYRAVKDDEALRSLDAGDVDINFQGSRYLSYYSEADKAYGIDTVFKKGNFSFHGFGAVPKGEEQVDSFLGRSRDNSITIPEYQFERNKYFQIEPFIRYDGIKDIGVIQSMSAASFYSTVIFTSAPVNPKQYRCSNVNIQSGSLEMWGDSLTAASNPSFFNNANLSGFFEKYSEGVDYTVNYTTGVITLLRQIRSDSRVFALYRLSGGQATSDPCARTDVVSGKNFVYLKYGSEIEEDSNRNLVLDSGEDRTGDGILNHDMYEIRSRYFIGDKNIDNTRVKVVVKKDGYVFSGSDLEKVGIYSIDGVSGMLQYELREPFRSILSESAKIIYEKYSSNLYTISRYTMDIGYVKEKPSYQLSQSPVVEGSVNVRVNGTSIASSLYTVDYEGGGVSFNDANNPTINENSKVEIRYQYSSQLNVNKEFAGGARCEYVLNDILRFGGSALYKRSGFSEYAPTAGSEPESLAVYEADSSIYLGPSRLGEIASGFTGKNIGEVPAEIKGYAEYARSYRNTNTFGKAIVDDIENADSGESVNLAENEWFLSSMNQSYSQTNRAKLLYKYYRDPSSPSDLYGEGHSAKDIPYSVKPGPYQISGGHIKDGSGQQIDDQQSLVFNADFATGVCASAGVRIDSESDVSGLDYIEVWYRSAGGSGSVNLSFDLGAISEDSDSDGVLDTEDTNRNGVLDYDFENGVYEDKGYTFNPGVSQTTIVGSGCGLNSLTKGDGVLSSEDINNNGIMESLERNISFPGSKAFSEDDVSYSPLQVNLADTSWKCAKIYLRRSALTEDDLYTLRNVSALRMNLVQGAGASTAQIWVDSIRLVSTRWSDIRVDGTATEDTDVIKSTLVDTVNNSEYRDHSFPKERRGDYESLYGEISDLGMYSEKETALSLQYNGTSSHLYSAGNILQRSVDLRNYENISFWYNSRELQSGDALRVDLGSSAIDYDSYEFPLQTKGSWVKVNLDLEEGSASKVGSTGNPNRRKVRYINVGVKSSGQGRIWINNFIATKPKTLRGDAQWYEGSIGLKRPVYITKKLKPVMDKVLVSYTSKRNNDTFSCPGFTEGENREENVVKTEAVILPGLSMQCELKSTQTSTDSAEEYSPIRSHERSLVFGLAGISDDQNTKYGLDYSVIGSENIFEYNSVETVIKNKEKKTAQTPVLYFQRKSFFLSSVESDLGIRLNNMFSHTSRDNPYAGSPEEEMYQNSIFDYSYSIKNKYVSILHKGDIEAKENVRWLESDENSDNKVRGDYHFPFFHSDENYKYIEREKPVFAFVESV